MNKYFKLSIVLILALFLITDTAFARGRGGGGRGGGRGGGGRSFSGSRGGGGRSFNHSRSPSSFNRSSYNRPTSRPQYSRPSSRPSSRPVSRPTTRPTTRPGTGNRPNFGNRPGAGNRPNFGNSNRPGSRPGNSNRPSTRPGTRPSTRPGTGNRPNVGNGNRPNIGNGNRPNIGGGNNNINIGNKNLNINNRHGYGIGNGNYHNHHNHWHHGNWNHGHHHYARAAAWGLGMWGVWNIGSRAYYSGYYPYSNPYYVETVVVQGLPAVNYSVPINVLENPEEPVSGEDPGMVEFDKGLAAFKNQNYRQALDHTNAALKILPNDASIHEFRSLVLFATRNYQEAAAGVYSVLSVGPGWDWTTLISLYEDSDTYTEQLRALEKECKSNSLDSAPHFLLAYHYLSCGHDGNAVKQLKIVSKMNPDDQLAKRLIGTFETKKESSKKESDPPEKNDEATPVKKEALVGTWVSDRGDQGKITLTLSSGGKYTWEYKSKSVSDSFSGTYSIGGNILTLVDKTGNPMVGNVTQSSANQFNFKLTGSGTNDPGLDFKK